MSKTAREVIAAEVAWLDDIDGTYAFVQDGPDHILKALGGAGFVIVPKEQLDRLLTAVDTYDEEGHIAVIDTKLWGDVTEARAALAKAEPSR